MSLINSTAIPSGATGYEIDNSLRFNDDDNTQLERTFTSAGDRKKWTWSAWIKRGNIATNMALFSGKANTGNIWLAGVDGIMRVEHYNGAGGYDFRRDFDGYHRDASAWYHFIIVYDSAQGSEVDRIKFYRNGQAVGVESTANAMTQNFQSEFNNNEAHWLGAFNHGFDYDGYMAEVNFIDGLAKAPADFGETGNYGEWKPIAYSGTYGTNGFYLNFATAADMGDDKSGNTNDWTEQNIAATDQMLDSPTNNFATWNPVEPTPTGLFAEGNTHYYANAVTTKGAVAGTIGISGKFYWEVLSSSTNQYHTEKIGIAADGFALNQHIGYESITWGYGSNGGSQYKWNNNSSTYVGGRQIGDIQMVAVDTDAGKVWFGRNGTWAESGNPATGANAQFTNIPAVVRPATSVNNTQNGIDGSICNFGQDSSFAGNKTAQGNQDGNDIGDFYYAPPTGFLALCTSNLPDATVVPSEHFNTVLYTGGGGTQSFTGVGFQPDLIWQKKRSNAGNHTLADAVRGTEKRLQVDNNSAEDTLSGFFSSFNSDGFTTSQYNDSGESYVAWNWKANGSGSSNTNGSINTTVSANVDAGFSIVSYTGTGTAGTVGHGLSSAPDIVIVKRRNATAYWYMNLKNIPSQSAQADMVGVLNESIAIDGYNVGSAIFSNTAPTSTHFTITTSAVVNANASTYIAYAFHSVDGYSKVGSYTGNGSTDGTFVYTGFRPAYVMIRRTDSNAQWTILDNKRDLYNVSKKLLYADSTSAEQDGISDRTPDWLVDFNSNGFKLRATNSDSNGNSANLIYLAFAEQPFKYSNAR